jgi:hypothetical protein
MEFQNVSSGEPWQIAGAANGILETEGEYKMGQTWWWKHQVFHANATVRHNKSTIRSLMDNNGVETFKHEEKSAISWEAFKDKLGVSEFSHIYFDLSDLIQLVDNLDGLVTPFQQWEVDIIIKELKSGKSLDSDGFNSDFMKKC